MNKELKKQKVFIQPAFFISACVLAIVGPALFLASLSGALPSISISPQTHATSMLFGFISALITGYLGGKQKSALAYFIITIWVIGRICEIILGEHWLTYCLYLAYGFVIICLIVPKFKNAKKWRNRSIMPLLCLIASFPFALFFLSFNVSIFQFSWLSFISLISCLMFFMAGRYLSPAIHRALSTQGLNSSINVQAKLEGAVIILLFTTFLLSTLQDAGYITGIALIATSSLVIIRLFRWQVYRLKLNHADVWSMVIGYGWLAIGLASLGLSLINQASLITGFHCITIGALGTLSSSIILKTTPSRKNPENKIFYISTTLIALATITRLSAANLGDVMIPVLLFSTLLWAFNFALILKRLIKRLYICRYNDWAFRRLRLLYETSWQARGRR